MMMLSAAGRQLHANTSEITANEILWQKCIVDTMLNLRSAENSASRKWCRITAARLAANTITSVESLELSKMISENVGAASAMAPHPTAINAIDPIVAQRK